MSSRFDERNNPFRIIKLGALLILLCVGLYFAATATDTVQNGTYHIVQYPVTGKISAKMSPGMYARLWGSVQEWPVSETFYFTDSNRDEGGHEDASIEVRFNDGATAHVSGTCRINLPRDADAAEKLSSEYGYKSYDDLEMKLILPTIRNALMMSANLMSSKESYSDKRPEFVNWAWDQIQKGLYVTEDQVVIVDDPATGSKTEKTVKKLKLDKNGEPVRSNIAPFIHTGITLSNFEIKNYIYDEKVKAQIATQQEAMMDIQTSMAKALKAKQEALTAEQDGIKKVTEAKYAAEVEKETATVNAERESEVANIKAKQELAVAELAAQTAEQTKQALITEGTGRAEAARLAIEADGALKLKMETIKEINAKWAEAYAKKSVPSVFMSGGDTSSDGISPDAQFTSFMSLLNAKAAKDLAVDLSIPESSPKKSAPKATPAPPAPPAAPAPALEHDGQLAK